MVAPSSPAPLGPAVLPAVLTSCVFSRPPPVSGPPHRPSPIVRPPESYQTSGFGRPMSSSVFPNQCPICRFVPPPDLCGWWYLAWVWVEGRRRRQAVTEGARSPDESRRGRKEGTTSSSTVKHRHLILRGQILGIVQANVPGWNYTTL